MVRYGAGLREVSEAAVRNLTARINENETCSMFGLWKGDRKKRKPVPSLWKDIPKYWEDTASVGSGPSNSIHSRRRRIDALTGWYCILFGGNREPVTLAATEPR